MDWAMINETSSNKHLFSSIKTHQDSETEKAYRLMRTAPDSQKKYGILIQLTLIKRALSPYYFNFCHSIFNT